MITHLDVIDVTPDGFLSREVTPAVTVTDLAAVTPSPLAVASDATSTARLSRLTPPVTCRHDIAKLVTTDCRSPGCTRCVGSGSCQVRRMRSEDASTSRGSCAGRLATEGDRLVGQ